MNEKIVVKEITKKHYDAFGMFTRSPATEFFSRELARYSNEEGTIIGTALLDMIDSDYAGIVSTRDEHGVFRAFDSMDSMASEEAARTWVIGSIKWNTAQNLRVFPQGFEIRGIDLFTPVITPGRFHPSFALLSREDTFVPARAIIKEMMPHYIDMDGNFVEQFQSTGFDARLWELYLFAYLTEERLFFDYKQASPDFLVKKYGKEVAIEAVTVGRKENNPPLILKEIPQALTPKQVREAHENSMPIIFGSPLYTKLHKKYWELPHIKGCPLVFAIADFHDDQSMLWSSTALFNYLYGVKHDFYYDASNQLVIKPSKISTHKVGDKEIPSGFFFQPETENVSAILFSSSGTISKFNRLGRQAGFYHPKVVMHRVGYCHDHDPNASLPRMFDYLVDESCTETWGEGLEMFHNPKAIYPVPEDLFPSISHHYFQDGQIVSYMPDFAPYSSITLNFRITEK